MVHVSAIGRCILSRISTCIFLLLSLRSNNKDEFSDGKLLLFFSNNFKVFI